MYETHVVGEYPVMCVRRWPVQVGHRKLNPEVVVVMSVREIVGRMKRGGG